MTQRRTTPDRQQGHTTLTANVHFFQSYFHDNVIKWKHFRVPCHLCREFAGHRWIPRTKASDAWLWLFFFICAWMNGWVNNREAVDLRRHRTHYDVAIMWPSMTMVSRYQGTVAHIVLSNGLFKSRCTVYLYPYCIFWQLPVQSVTKISSSGGRLNKKDGLTRYGNSHVKDKTS